MRFLVLLLAIFALSWSPAARAQTPSWQVSEVSGDVRLQNGDGVRAARRGVSLSPGDAVITGVGGRAVMTRGQEFVIVSPGSRLRLPGAAERPGGVVQMLQDLGTAVYRIQKKMTPHFGVQTPYLAAVVKGTTFRVVAGPQGASVQVLEGRVEVATSDGRETRMAVPGLLVAVSAAQPDRLTVGADTSAAKDTARTAKTESTKVEGDKSADADKRADGKSDRADDPRFTGRGNADADVGRGPRQDGPDGDRQGAVVTRTPGEKAAVVNLPQAARNAQPPKGDKPDADPKAPKPDKNPDAPKPGKGPEAPKGDEPKPDVPKPDAPKPDKQPDAPKVEEPKPDKPKDDPKPAPVTPAAPPAPAPVTPAPAPAPAPTPAPAPAPAPVTPPAPAPMTPAPAPAPPPPPAAPGGDDDDDDDDNKDKDKDKDKDDDDDSGSIGSLIASALAPLPAIDAPPAPAPVPTDPSTVPPLGSFAQPVPTPPAPQPPMIAMDGALGLDRLFPPR